MTPERWKQIEQLYHSALERESEERAAYLQQACAGDAALRKEVESLLAHGKTTDGWSSSGALGEIAANVLGQPDSRSLLGRKLGSFEILSLLGAGGMGEVYEARDTKLGRNVAIKFLPKDFVHDPERLARFQREAKMLASLNHPNIATIHGLEQSDGVHYLVMELVPGQTLAERISKGAWPLPEALKVASQIAEALEAAHEKGVIHRDLKPANVKVTPEGRVKVLDFGLAKAFAGDGEQDLSQALTLTAVGTEDGSILGTPAYMSPEQARGKAVDKRTDIWAFGCVLYEMLTRRVPFRGKTMSDTIAAIIERTPEWDALTANTPDRVRRLLLRCLEKNPTRRLRDIGEARVELEEALRPTVAVTAGALPKKIRLWLWPMLAAAGAAVIVLAAGNVGRLSTGLLGVTSQVRIASVAVLPLTNVNADSDMEYQADGLTDRIIDELSQLPDLKVMSHRAAFLYKGRDVDPREVGRQLGVEAVLTGRVSTRDNIVTINLELVDARDSRHLWGQSYVNKVSDLLGVDAGIPVDIAGRLGSRLGGPMKERLTRQQTNNTEAYRLYLQGRQAYERWNQDGSRAAIAYFEQAIAEDPDYALAYSGLADTYVFGTTPGVPVKEANQRAREAVAKALALDPALGEAHASLAQLLMSDDWNFASAEREFKRAIELSPSYIEGHHMYSHFLLAMGRIDESLVESRKVMELDPQSPLGIGHLAFHQLYARQYDDAISTFQTYFEKEKNDVDSYREWGDAYYQKGMMREAVEAFLKGDSMQTAPEEVAALRRAFAERGMNGYLREWIRHLRAGQSTTTSSIIARPTQIAGAYARLGDLNSAFEWLEKAYAEHNPALVHLREDVVFDKLRPDPRFADLLRRIGLPPV